jgi:hypothetical protein
MSHIISNPEVEKDMSKKFFCILYRRDRNNLEIRDQGMDPFEIWQEIDYRAFHENVVPVIIDKLISNNMHLDLLTFNIDTKKVKMTEFGRQQGILFCN